MPWWLAWALRWMVVLVIECEYERKNWCVCDEISSRGVPGRDMMS